MQRLRRWLKRSEHRAVLPVVAAALLARVTYFFHFKKNPHSGIIFSGSDALNFHQGAIAFAQGDWLANAPNNTYAPLYKYFVGCLYKVFGVNLNLVWIVQMGFGVVSCVLLYWIALRFLSWTYALGAAVAFAFYGPELMTEGLMLREFLVTFLGLASLWSVLRLQEKETRRRAIVCGVSLSLFLQVRPNTLFVVAAVAGLVAFRLSKPLLKVFWLAFIGVSVPLLIQCYLVFHHFVFYDASGVSVLYVGNLLSYSGHGYPGWGNPDLQAVMNHYGASFSGFFTYLMDLWRYRLVDWLGLYGRKVFFLFNRYEIPSNYCYDLFAYYSFWLRSPLCEFSLFAVFGFLGLGFAWRKRSAWLLPMIFVLGLLAGLLPAHNEDRFRLPLVPFLALFSAYAVFRIGVWIHEKRWGRVGVILAGAFVAMWLLRIPDELAYRIRPKDFMNTAAAALQSPRQDPEQAKVMIAAAWTQTQRLGGDVLPRRTAMIQFYRGVLRSQLSRGQVKEAIQELETVLVLNEPVSEDYLVLADLYARQGRRRDAQRATVLAWILEPKKMPKDKAKVALTVETDATLLELLRNPNDAELHAERAKECEKARNLPWAAFHWRKVLALDHGHADRGAIEHWLRAYEDDRRTQAFPLFDPFARLRAL